MEGGLGWQVGGRLTGGWAGRLAGGWLADQGGLAGWRRLAGRCKVMAGDTQADRWLAGR